MTDYCENAMKRERKTQKPAKAFLAMKALWTSPNRKKFRVLSWKEINIASLFPSNLTVVCHFATAVYHIYMYFTCTKVTEAMASSGPVLVLQLVALKILMEVPFTQ